MVENDLNNPVRYNPVLSVLLILVLSASGFVLGPFVAFYIYLPFYEGTEKDLLAAISNLEDHPEIKLPLYGMQAAATIVGLVLAPYFFLRSRRRSLAELFAKQKWEVVPVLIVSVTIITFTGLNSVVIEWNSNVNFPEFLQGFENWARDLEETAGKQTKALTDFTSVWELLVGLLVIAVLAAIGEEIVFRGLIQNELYRATRNIHVAIWLAAFIFSAFHFQFFGFVPRLFLGALFGYLYYWSGNLYMPILGHFVNNGVSVVAMYFYQKGAFEFDLETPEAAPANVVMLSAVLTAGLLYYFYKYFEHRKPSIPRV
jgi:membrane protease YdiL (CAAX protease family)